MELICRLSGQPLSHEMYITNTQIAVIRTLRPCQPIVVFSFRKLNDQAKQCKTFIMNNESRAAADDIRRKLQAIVSLIEKGNTYEAVSRIETLFNEHERLIFAIGGYDIYEKAALAFAQKGCYSQAIKLSREVAGTQTRHKVLRQIAAFRSSIPQNPRDPGFRSNGVLPALLVGLGLTASSWSILYKSGQLTSLTAVTISTIVFWFSTAITVVLFDRLLMEHLHQSDLNPDIE